MRKVVYREGGENGFYACEDRQALFLIREMQIATKMRYWFSLITLAKIKESNKPPVGGEWGLWSAGTVECGGCVECGLPEGCWAVCARADASTLTW